MKIEVLQKNESDFNLQKLKNTYLKLHQLVKDLKERPLGDEATLKINQYIHKINQLTGSEKEISKQTNKQLNEILKYLEIQFELVGLNHYRNKWLALGLSVFGIPLGVVFGFTLGNMAFLGIGLPIGLVIGMAVGSKLDQKAADEGKQLNIEL